MFKSLFIIYTPYQLISAVNIIQMLDLRQSDCLIVHKNLLVYKEEMAKYFSGDIYYFEELTEKLFFENTFLTKISILYRIITAKKYVNKIKFLQNKYDSLYVPSDEVICRIVYRKVLTINPSVKLYLIDDGIGTYLGNLFARKKLISKIIYSLLLTNRYSEDVKKIFCYHPELLDHKTIKVDFHEIEYDARIDIFHSFVSKYVSAYIGKKIIYLDQGIFNEQSKRILLYLAKVFGKDSILIKKHPRIGGCDFYKDYIIVDDGLPFEAIVSEIECSSCLIISHSSTGCITPYLLFGIKPKVILFYSMDKKEHKTSIIDFVDSINRCIGEEYIKLPNNTDEFVSTVQKLKGHIKPICLKEGKEK